MADPASPEGMLRSYHGEDDTGLSAIKEKPVDNRSTWQQLREYLTTGINEDARYALGPHAAPAVKGISSLAAELTPAADTRDALVESQKTAEAVSEGKALEAGIGGLSTLASLAAMFVPGSLSGAKKGTEEVTKQVSKNLPKQKQGLKSVDIDEDLFEGILKTPEGDPVVLYRGTYSSSRRRSAEDTENILQGKPNEGYASFLSDNPNIAATYAGEKGFITPFIVKPKQLIEFDNSVSRNLVDGRGGFNFVEFDRQAKNLGPGEVLVVRNVRDTGPRVVRSGSGIDEPKYWSYGGDIYATNDDRVLLSAINPKSREAKLAPTQVSELFSRKKDSIGDTSFSGDTYSSFEIPMTKTKFFDNAEKLNPKKESIKFLKKEVTRKGKKLGIPHIALEWDGLRWKPIKSNHEGRHRMLVAEDFLGKNVEVPVNVQLRNKAGNKIPVDELIGNRRYYTVKDSEEAKKMLSELEKWKEAPTNAEYMKMPTRVGRRTDEEAEQFLIARRKKLAKERRGKKKGGSVIERNLYNYPPKSI
jgi:hypothetical protein